MIVRAHLKNVLLRGVVIGEARPPEHGEIKDLCDVEYDAPILNDALTKLLCWMSDYYLAEHGLVLKHFLPGELFSRQERRKRNRSLPKGQEPLAPRAIPLDNTPIDDALCRRVTEAIRGGTFKTFLLHAPTTLYPRAFLRRIIGDSRNGIVIVPEMHSLSALYTCLHDAFGERICLYHGGLSPARKRSALEKILSGHIDIVMGTRIAVFAPLKRVSFIAVLDEHSPSYKEQKIPSYHGRDVAVMRGLFENATVLLASIAPSVESFFNCRQGKYTLLRPRESGDKRRIRLVDMRYEKRGRFSLSRISTDKTASCLKRDGKVLFLINRRGYATLLACEECGHVEECPTCAIPLVYHKQDTALKCHYCGFVRPRVPELCRICGGHAIRLLGIGTQRVQEDVDRLFGVKSLRIDRDRMISTGTLRTRMRPAEMPDARLVIGTTLMSRWLSRGAEYSLAVLLNADSFLNRADFRSAERAFQEIATVLDAVRYDGEVLIQTRMPDHYVFEALKRGDHELFYREEIRKRRSLLYPPFSRVIVLACVSSRNASAHMEQIRAQGYGDVTVLGPAVSGQKTKGIEHRWLLKSPRREHLHAATRRIMKALKESKDIRITIDVDPVDL